MLDPKDRISFGDSNGRPDGSGDPVHPLHNLLTQAGLLGDYAAHFTLAKLDAAKVRIRHLAVAVGLGIIGLFLACTLVVVGATYVAAGIAGGLATGLEIPTWLSQLLTGFLGLALPSAVISLIWMSSRAKHRKRKVHKYELRKAKRRARLAREPKGTKREAA